MQAALVFDSHYLKRRLIMKKTHMTHGTSLFKRNTAICMIQRCD